MATIIKISGEKENIEPENGKTFSLKELQEAVGGYIQLVSINDGEYAGKLMICDEEGLLKANQLNEEATRIAGQQIVGQVIIIEKNQIE
jgi:hypothetical protein